jgi:hypothetical protein
MFEKVAQAAEQVAMNVSRRQFLGRLGGRAMVMAGALAGVLAFPRVAHAHHPCFSSSGVYQCNGNEVCCFGRFCTPPDRCKGG